MSFTPGFKILNAEFTDLQMLRTAAARQSKKNGSHQAGPEAQRQ